MGEAIELVDWLRAQGATAAQRLKSSRSAEADRLQELEEAEVTLLGLLLATDPAHVRARLADPATLLARAASQVECAECELAAARDKVAWQINEARVWEMRMSQTEATSARALGLPEGVRHG